MMSKILVIGDGCTDIFQYGTCNRLSPEAPVPIFQPTTLTSSGGMSINVMENIKALGSECDIITNDFRPTKTRYVEEESNQILLRVDTNDKIKRVNPEALNQTSFTDYDAVIISDYDKGFLKIEDIQRIATLHSLVFMDTKKILGEWMPKIKFLKLNKKEYFVNRDWFLNESETTVIMTQGKEGAVLNHFKTFPIKNEHPVRDLSGAGDTFLAALVVRYLDTNNIEESIIFANKCAAWVVTQKGVVPVNPQMI